jgi:glutathione S-transferase
VWAGKALQASGARSRHARCGDSARYARKHVTESFVLYIEASWSSPWVCAVYATLREKTIPFTTSLAMLRHGSGLVDVMHERTLTGTAPVLQHGAFWLAESSAIVEYLEDVVPEPRMLPIDPRERARARQVAAWMRSEHAVLRQERPAERIFYPAVPIGELSPEGRAAAASLVRVAERLGADARGYVLGGRFGVIDVELAFALMRLVATDYELPEAVIAYARAVFARPSVRDFVEHVRPPNPP